MKHLIAFLLLGSLLVSHSIAQDDKSIEKLQKQIDRLQKQIDEISKQKRSANKPAKAKPTERAAKNDKTGDDASTKGTKFLRVDRDDRGRPMTLDTAIVRYEKGGISVDLIGAIHLGETSYYKKLNGRFNQYKAVLYEMVSEKGAQAAKEEPKQGELAHSLAAVQGMVSKMLGLQFQMSGVDYSPKNFVHADLSPAELQKRMQQRGDSPMILFVDLLIQQMRQMNLQAKKPKAKNPKAKNTADAISDEELARGLLRAILTDKGSPVLRRYLALRFEDLETQMKAFGGNLGKLLIDDRNTACFKVLDAQIQGGKKNIGIFYGVAHMPDMEKRLLKRGFQKKNTLWLEAWKLR